MGHAGRGRLGRRCGEGQSHCALAKNLIRKKVLNTKQWNDWLLNGRATLDVEIELRCAGVIQTRGNSCKETAEAVRAPLAKAHKQGIAGNQREAAMAKETE